MLLTDEDSLPEDKNEEKETFAKGSECSKDYK